MIRFDDDPMNYLAALSQTALGREGPIKRKDTCCSRLEALRLLVPGSQTLEDLGSLAFASLNLFNSGDVNTFQRQWSTRRC